MKELRAVLIEYYLDYVNNFLTMEKFAEHNGLSLSHAHTLLILGKQLNETPHPEG